MKTRNVIKTPTPSIVWFKGSKAYVEDKEAIRVIIETRLRTIYQEVWSDPNTRKNVGIPYFQKKNKEEYDLLIKREINSVDGVQEVIEMNSKMIGNDYRAKIVVLTNVGEVAVEL